MRLLRNREVRRGLLLLTGITAALCAVGWAMAGPCCAGLLLVSGAASAAVYLVSARRRYRALADHESGHRPGTPWVGQPDHRRLRRGRACHPVQRDPENDCPAAAGGGQPASGTHAAGGCHGGHLPPAADAFDSHQPDAVHAGTRGAAGTGAPGTSAGAAAAGDPHGVAGGDAFENVPH